jgi:hypothetical protein
MSSKSGTSSAKKASSGKPKNRPVRDMIAADFKTTDKDYSWNGPLSPNPVLGLRIQFVDKDTTKMTKVTLFGACLPTLTSRAASNRQYRITSATLIFTPETGHDVTGTLLVRSYPDASLWSSTLNSSNADKAVPLARGTIVRIPLNVDPAWKSVAGSLFEFTSEPLPIVAPMNDLNSMICSFVQLKTNNAPKQTLIGSFEVEYHPEFRGAK